MRIIREKNTSNIEEVRYVKYGAIVKHDDRYYIVAYASLVDFIIMGDKVLLVNLENGASKLIDMETKVKIIEGELTVYDSNKA